MTPSIDHRPTDRNKVVSAAQAVRLIRDGDTVATGGFVGIGFAEEIAIAIEERFKSGDGPHDLKLVYPAGQGDGRSKGLNHLAHECLVRCVIGGHWGLVPGLGRLALENKIEAYNLPQGVISCLFRDIAARRPGHLSRIGLGTFVDPRHGGGRMNERTKRSIVEAMTIDGEEFLFYKAFPVNVAIIRATTADLEGNLTMEREALTLEALSMATAAHNSGGIVIAQVERLADRGALKPRDVKVPGLLVDCVVVAESDHHWQTFGTRYSAGFSGEMRVPTQAKEPLPLDARKIIARRAALELKANSVVNLGIGMPEGIASVANEERVVDLLTLTTEPGVIGGVPAGGLDFGAAVNTQAVIDQPYQFDFYDGGGLDIAFLGLAQADKEGNLNVSRFGNRFAGAGGFINISQSAKKVVFVGTFTAGQLDVAVADGRLRIVREGETRKFVEAVEHRTFSGAVASRRGQPTLYITERCVLRLCEVEGNPSLELIEVAPGVDIERDIMSQMAFRPRISSSLREMPAHLFKDELMGLRGDLLCLPLDQRFSFDMERQHFFANFESFTVRNSVDVAAIRAELERRLVPLGRKVPAIVNYDNFTVAADVLDAYVDMVRDVAQERYSEVTRYTTSAFVHAKLGAALKDRGLPPHIFDSPEEARLRLLELAKSSPR